MVLKCHLPQCERSGRGELHVIGSTKRARSPSPPRAAFENSYSSSERLAKAPYGAPLHNPAYANRPPGGYYGQPEHTQAYHSPATGPHSQAYQYPPTGPHARPFYDERAPPVLEAHLAGHHYAPIIQRPSPGYTITGDLRGQSPDRYETTRPGNNYNTGYLRDAWRRPSPDRYQVPYQGASRNIDDRRASYASHDYERTSNGSAYDRSPSRRRETSDRGNSIRIRMEDIELNDMPLDRGRSLHNLSNDSRRADPAYGRGHYKSPNRTRRSDPALDRNSAAFSDRKIAPLRQNKTHKSTRSNPQHDAPSGGKPRPANECKPSSSTGKTGKKQDSSASKHLPQPLSESAQREAVLKARLAPILDYDRRLLADLDYGDDMPPKIRAMYVHCSKCMRAGHRAKGCNNTKPTYTLPWMGGPSPGVRPTAPATLQQIHAWFAYLGCSVQQYSKYVEQRNRFYKALVPVLTEYVRQMYRSQRVVTTFHRLIDRSMNDVEQVQELQFNTMVKLFRVHIKDRLVKINEPTTDPKNVEDMRAVLWLNDPLRHLHESLVVTDDELTQISTEWETVRTESNNRRGSMSDKLTDYMDNLPYADPAIKSALSLVLDFMPMDPRKSDSQGWLAPVRWPSCFEMDAVYSIFLAACHEQLELRRQSLLGG